MTIDPPLVLCWTLSMVAGWRAVQPAGTLKQWLLVGLAAGLGFLCKYSAAYLIADWVLFLFVWPPARRQLKKPGPYLALLNFSLCMLPVIIWNWQHGWATVGHVAGNAGLHSRWHSTVRFFWEFFFLEAGLLNPVFLSERFGRLEATSREPSGSLFVLHGDAGVPWTLGVLALFASVP